jgi:ABC-type lipoprotein export system ATPase subunit
MSTTQKAGNSLLLTTNNSNGKTIVMPTHNLNSNNLSATSGTSLLLQTNQKVPTSKSDHVIIQKQNSKLHGLDNNSIRIVLEDKFLREAFTIIFNP